MTERASGQDRESAAVGDEVEGGGVPRSRDAGRREGRGDGVVMEHPPPERSPLTGGRSPPFADRPPPTPPLRLRLRV